nr:MAG TPA: HNH endonuclease, GmR87, NESG, Structural Genomics.6A [Caudoviricetes sp.]
MQKYQSDFLKSRKKSEHDHIPCELCGAVASDIHHIMSSHRGMRQHNPDGSDLIALCRSCHAYIHAHNTPVMRESLMAIVAYRLITLE